MKCPSCGSRGIGRVGHGQFYCWDCCIEFSVDKQGIRVYHLDAEGELTLTEARREVPEGGCAIQ